MAKAPKSSGGFLNDLTGIGSAVGAATSIIGALGGIFGKKKKKSAQQIQMERDAREANKQRKMLMDMAMNFDPSKANTAILDEIERRTGRTLQNSQTQLMGNWAKGGAAMGGDTVQLVQRQRALDDVTQPLGMEIARMRANEAAQSLAMKMDAFSRLNPGNNQYAPQAQPVNRDNDYMNLASGLDTILSRRSQSPSVSNAPQANSPYLPVSPYAIGGAADAARKYKAKKGAQVAGSVMSQLRF